MADNSNILKKVSVRVTIKNGLCYPVITVERIESTTVNMGYPSYEDAKRFGDEIASIIVHAYMQDENSPALLVADVLDAKKQGAARNSKRTEG